MMAPRNADAASRIRQTRLARGWKTYRAADRATGISRDNWANWETGRVFPSWKNLERLADALGVEERWLLTGEGPRERESHGTSRRRLRRVGE